jgi:hypothetical protein
LLVARNREGRSTWKQVLSWIAAIVIVTTVPFAVRSPVAFMSNVFAFPLGIAGVSSPAASALPGHILTSWLPWLGHVLAPVSLLIGGYFATKYIRRNWALTLSQMLGLLSIAFLGMICVASATRVGYVIYPLNLWLWSSVTRESPVVAEELSIELDRVGVLIDGELPVDASGGGLRHRNSSLPIETIAAGFLEE